MFGSMRDFLYRHRRKFMFAGIVVGGVALLGKLAERKLLAWYDEQALKMVAQKRRKQHYERSLDTTRMALLHLIPNVRKVLETELDADILIQAIKHQPEKKRELWEQLKIVGFGRAVCTIICTAVAAPVSHVMMMVLAANTLDHAAEGAIDSKGSTNTTTTKPKTVSLEVQTRYLSCLQDMIEEQLPNLVSKVVEITSNTLSTLPLTRKLTLSQLESILQQITLSATNSRDCSEFVGGDQRSFHSVLPWSRYLKEPEAIMSHPDSNDQLRSMYFLTVDILNTDDFNEVVNTLVQVGLNYVLDEVAGFYFTSHFDYQETNSVAQKSELADKNATEGSLKSTIVSSNINPDGTECLERNEISEEKACDDAKAILSCGITDESVIPNTSSAPKKREANQSEDQTSAIGSESLDVRSVQDCSNISATTNQIGCDVPTGVGAGGDHSGDLVGRAVAKLVPVLSSIVHTALPNVRQLPAHLVPGDSNATYYSRLVVCSQLEALAYNVYDTLVLSDAEL